MHLAADFQLRIACAADLPAIIALLAGDSMGSGSETVSEPLPGPYLDAFAAIEADPNNEQWVFQAPDGGLAGCYQLTFIPGLEHHGGWRATIEGVRVAGSRRGQGLGRLMMKQAIGRARQRGCYIVQLTSNKQRTAAHAFYEGLGFTPSHEGYKLIL